ncbi:MAG TPA: HAD family hydrolase [Thermomicrobiales bacterium]|jgi:HAD superfamily hydrolase (TIGR01509 family)
MLLKAVTIDFHNTIARSDRWFELEVLELVPEVLRLCAEQGALVMDDDLPERARAAYRALRQGIIASGEERDALDCALATLTEIGVTLPESAAAAAIETLMRDALTDATPMPGVIAAIGTLRSRGMRLGVVSSAVHHPYLDWTLRQFGIGDAFATVITSASSGYYKSRPEIYHAALRELGVTAAETVHVGDSYRFDVQGAKRAGMRAVWYAPTNVALAQPNNEADATIADLATLPTVIATLAGEDAPRKRWWQR